MRCSAALVLLGSLLLGPVAACSDADDAPEHRPADAEVSALLGDSDEAPSADPAEPTAGDHALGLQREDGSFARYLLHAPPGIEEIDAPPLVLVFHGRPGSPEAMAALTGFDDLADRDGYLVAYPDNWTDVADVDALIDHLVAGWGVDRRRVFATGFSAGAALTYKLADELSDKIAAFAPVSGIDIRPFAPARTPSLLTVQGTRDSLWGSFAGGNAAWREGAGCDRPRRTSVRLGSRRASLATARCRDGQVHQVYTVRGLGHEWPAAATGLIWRFFRDHPRTR